MTEFVDQDLSGSRFVRTELRDAEFERVKLNGAQLRAVNLSDAEIRGAALYRTRMIGVEMWDVEITGEIRNVTVNGVDIAPLVEAELNRRMPDRAKMNPSDPAGYLEAWDLLERRWAATIDAARALPPERLHERVNGEWSFIETLRHLNFAIAAWFGRMILGDPSPWHPLDLPWDEAPGWDGIPWDRDARPSLDEVLAVREQRHAMVRGVVEHLTAEQLASTVSRTEPGWPQLEDMPFDECVKVILNEEWEHRLYAERDLAALG